jgi:hypothetical protein
MRVGFSDTFNSSPLFQVQYSHRLGRSEKKFFLKFFFFFFTLSSETEIKYLRVGCHFTPRTQLSCPYKVNIHNPVEVSQILIDLSRDPEAKKAPGTPPDL